MTQQSIGNYIRTLVLTSNHLTWDEVETYLRYHGNRFVDNLNEQRVWNRVQLNRAIRKEADDWFFTN